MSMRPIMLSTACLMVASCSPDAGGFVSFNTPPAVSIIEPLEGQIFDQGETIVFRGLVADNGGVADLDIQWSSSIDGLLLDTDTPDPNGAVELATASLSQGTHIVTLRAFDLDAQQGEARVNIVVEGVPESPSITIEHPLPGETALENAAYRFVVKVRDAQDIPQDLIIELESDRDGYVCALNADSSGIAYCEHVLSMGEHMLTFTVTDTDEYTNAASAVFHVVSLQDYDGDRDGFTPRQNDCDDNNNTIYPGAPEICDGVDNDCNPATPIDVGTACYDDDGDNYCEAPPCRNASGTLPDCNDAAHNVYPGAPEIPDGVDNDCNGRIDDGLSNYDDDGDGYCETPPCVNASGMLPDCDDNNYSVHPGRTEICGDGLDNNCNGTQNEKNAQGCTTFYVDVDGDGYASRTDSRSECWCEPHGDFGAVNRNDCYDFNANARPGQTQWFTEHRGDGSFDYDCNGSSSLRYTSRTQCNTGGEWSFYCEASTTNGGWEQNIPGCGQTGSWVNDCEMDYPWGAYILCAVQLGFAQDSSQFFTCVLQNGGSCNMEYNGNRTQQMCH